MKIIHIQYCKTGQKPVAMKVIGPNVEATTAILLNDFFFWREENKFTEPEDNSTFRNTCCQVLQPELNPTIHRVGEPLPKVVF